jgi:hypothetical protein
MKSCEPHIFGANPLNIKWNIVRGDTAVLRVDFTEADEVTAIDIEDWDFQATAYNPFNGLTDDLEVDIGEGFVQVVAPSDITESWGVGTGKVADLKFDLQVTTDDGSIWTPVLGTISVTGDITGGVFQ